MLSSLHSFKLPSYFCDGPAPLGTAYPRRKIPNLNERFMERKFKVALFTVLREYYALYKQSGLPALESDFSKTVGNLYRHDHRRRASYWSTASSRTAARNGSREGHAEQTQGGGMRRARRR